jgi:homoserine dehydrogenase
MYRLSLTDFAAHGPLRVGLIGFGCVGQGFFDILRQLPYANIEVTRIAVKHAGKARPLPPERFEFNADALVHDPMLDVLVEVIDDAEEAFRLVSTALRLGRHVVTANKAMLARNLTTLLRLEKKHGGTLLYEAAVAGSIPILRTLDAHFGTEPLLAVRGILNGSSNYVLSRMAEESCAYATALREAQALGFAETDPALDMAAFDPRSKAVLLAAHAFGVLVHPERLLNLGIENIAPEDLAFAAARGQKVKVVADIRQQTNGSVSIAVMPQLVDAHSALYAVEREVNGVELVGAFAGSQFLRGKGAGGHPTGSAVLADVLALRRGYRYAYSKLRETAGRPLAEGLEAEVYLRHATAEGLAAVLAWLDLPAVPGQRATTGYVRLDALRARRDALREAGVFIARLGEMRFATPVQLLQEAEAL